MLHGLHLAGVGHRHTLPDTIISKTSHHGLE